MVSLASPKQVAGKIAAAHNARECKHCQRPLPDHGVLAFGLSGSDARWYPDESTARASTPGVRIVFAVQPEPVAPEHVIAWLEQQRDELDAQIQHVYEQREQRRVAREIRENDFGFRTDPYPCEDCAKYGVTHYKHRPADRCDRCGDEPCPVGIDVHDYNRGYGYRD